MPYFGKKLYFRFFASDLRYKQDIWVKKLVKKHNLISKKGGGWGPIPWHLSYIFLKDMNFFVENSNVFFGKSTF